MGKNKIKLPKRGGKRKGAGRPKTKEETKVMRVPVSKIKAVYELISKQEIKCPECGSMNCIMFSSDWDLCKNCGFTF